MFILALQPSRVLEPLFFTSEFSIVECVHHLFSHIECLNVVDKIFLKDGPTYHGVDNTICH